MGEISGIIRKLITPEKIMQMEHNKLGISTIIFIMLAGLCCLSSFFAFIGRYLLTCTKHKSHFTSQNCRLSQYIFSDSLKSKENLFACLRICSTVTCACDLCNVFLLFLSGGP